MRKILVSMAALMAVVLTAGAALADFSPKFSMELSDTKAKANPDMSFHLEFDADDEEIGLFTAKMPKGFNIAADEDIADGTVIGAGEVTIQAGLACRPGPEGQIPLSAPVTIPAEFEERDRTDEEADSGVHSVWFLNLEPANRVRLLVTGSAKRGWTVSGAPDPSDNTCNPLEVDLTINGTADDTPVITNPTKPGKYVFNAEIASQDSAAVAKFKHVVKITK